jgi:hypothetical protein
MPWYGLDSSDLDCGPVVGSCEHSKEPSGKVKENPWVAKWLVDSQELLSSKNLDTCISKKFFKYTCIWLQYITINTYSRNQQEGDKQSLLPASCWVCSSTLKIEAVHSSETSVNVHQTTQCYFPKDSTLHSQCCENLKCNNVFVISICTDGGLWLKHRWWQVSE